MRIDLESMTRDEYECYRETCDSRSAAEFRFRREACGIELVELSEALDVRLDTAKRWENPKKGLPPSLRAWAYVDSAYLDMLDEVEAAIQAAEAEDARTDAVPTVRIGYRRGINDASGGKTVFQSNAVARACAIGLTVLGYGVEVVWVDSADGPSVR